MALSEGFDKSTLLAKNCACSRPRVVDCKVFAALQEWRVLDLSFGSRRLNLPASHVDITTRDAKLLAIRSLGGNEEHLKLCRQLFWEVND
jgi:hypothetical protein